MYQKGHITSKVDGTVCILAPAYFMISSTAWSVCVESNIAIQGTKILKISIYPADHRVWLKQEKMFSKFLLVLHAIPLVRAIRRAEFLLKIEVFYHLNSTNQAKKIVNTFTLRMLH